MCFGFRISSMIHLATLTIPIQNQKYPQNVKNTHRDTHFSKVKTACNTEDLNFTCVCFFLGQGHQGQGHCNECNFLIINSTFIGYFFSTKTAIFSHQCNLLERRSHAAPCQWEREHTSWDRCDLSSQNLFGSKSYLSIAWSAPSLSTSALLNQALSAAAEVFQGEERGPLRGQSLNWTSNGDGVSPHVFLAFWGHFWFWIGIG